MNSVPEFLPARQQPSPYSKWTVAAAVALATLVGIPLTQVAAQNPQTGNTLPTSSQEPQKATAVMGDRVWKPFSNTWWGVAIADCVDSSTSQAMTYGLVDRYAPELDGKHALKVACNKLHVNGVNVVFGERRLIPATTEIDAPIIAVAPLDMAITGMRVDSPEEGKRMYEYIVHSAFINGKRMSIIPDEDWSGTQCGEERFAVGRRGWAVLCADAYTSDEPPKSTGTVTISHWKTDFTCTFQVHSGRLTQRQYFLLVAEKNEENPDQPFGPCTRDTADSIEFEQLPSAARILLTNDIGCSLARDNKFWIELRTVEKNVTTNAIKFDEILSYPLEAIIRPGLQLVSFHRENGASAQKALGCIRVTTSGSPPAG